MSVQIVYELDPRWEGYDPPFGKQTFIRLADSIITPTENVPKQVVLKLEQVKSIIRCCAIDYELQDVALFLMLGILEYALRDKYSKINNQSTGVGMKSLLTWAAGKKFIKLNESQINSISSMRNDFAHLNNPETLFGVMASQMIELFNKLINNLYDNQKV